MRCRLHLRRRRLEVRCWLHLRRLEVRCWLRLGRRLEVRYWLRLGRLEVRCWLHLRRRLEVRCWLHLRRRLRVGGWDDGGLEGQALEDGRWAQRRHDRVDAGLAHVVAQRLAGGSGVLQQRHQPQCEGELQWAQCSLPSDSRRVPHLPHARIARRVPHRTVRERESLAELAPLLAYWCAQS